MNISTITSTTDIEIKVAKIFRECPKNNHSSFHLKSDFFQNSSEN